MPLVKTNSSRSGFMILMLIAFTSIILGLSVTFYSYCKRSADDSAIAVRLVNQRLALAGALQYITSFTVGANAPVDTDTTAVGTAAASWAAPLISNWGNPSSTTIPSPSNPFNLPRTDPSPVAIISLKDSTVYRAKSLGWFRVSYPYMSVLVTNQSRSDLQFYFTGQATGLTPTEKITNALDLATRNAISALVPPTVLPADKFILQNCLLVATGCGPSQGNFTATTNWKLENVSWYLVELRARTTSPPLPLLPTEGAIRRVISIFPPPQSQTPNQAISSAGTPFYW